MPYIVVVIDESNLMMVAGKKLNHWQKVGSDGRAGHSSYSATQRPSGVITGTIKANFPSRISYSVK